MRTQALATSMVAFLAAPSLAGGHATVSGYALADDSATLLVMADVAAPGDMTTIALGAPLRAIAWRPVTGELLGFANGMIVTVDPVSGETTNLDAEFTDSAMIADDVAMGFDFNNRIDAARAVTTAGDNLVYFPEGFGDGDDRAGAVRRFTDFAYAEGDAMAGQTPMIFANAYTNAIDGRTAGETFQYALDAETDALVSLANNASLLETIAPVTVGGAPVDLAPIGGFDIVSTEEGANTAYAILQRDGADTAGLYTIDLETGAATLAADLGVGGISGFAAPLGM